MKEVNRVLGNAPRFRCRTNPTLAFVKADHNEPVDIMCGNSELPFTAFTDGLEPNTRTLIKEFRPSPRPQAP